MRLFILTSDPCSSAVGTPDNTCALATDHALSKATKTGYNGNLNITKGQGTGKMCSLYQGILFPITGAKSIVHYIEDLGSLYRGSTEQYFY